MIRNENLSTMNRGGEEATLEIFYPRSDNNPSTIRLALFDVRAANDLLVRYDFERDGWSILSDMHDPDLDPDVDQEDTLQEVAFIEAWPLRNKG